MSRQRAYIVRMSRSILNGSGRLLRKVGNVILSDIPSSYIHEEYVWICLLVILSLVGMALVGLNVHWRKHL